MAIHRSSASAPPEDDFENDLNQFAAVRAQTQRLARPLEPEDMLVQSMDDVSPTKWHLAHTTWFFDAFLLEPFSHDYRPFHPAYKMLFNSYYNSVGELHPRPRRGLLSRPTATQVSEYREHVDGEITDLLNTAEAENIDKLAELLVLGCHHEQQHQELILTDIKHVLSCNPLQPAYQERNDERPTEPTSRPVAWTRFDGGLGWIGDKGDGFAFDNERPRHRNYMAPFEIAGRPVTNGEFIEFIEDAGYRRPELWLSDGWDVVNKQGWDMPLYWQRHDGSYETFTLAGTKKISETEPVCHVSHFEADAFARWAGARLPTEAEWEVASKRCSSGTNLADSGHLHPRPTGYGEDGPAAMLGDVWEWTSSPYTPYPGYKPPPGALGEYNGKFMSGQMVLRGGSCLTPTTHVRPTYRNFFPPDARWQMSGLRLARDVD